MLAFVSLKGHVTKTKATKVSCNVLLPMFDVTYDFVLRCVLSLAESMFGVCLS